MRIVIAFLAMVTWPAGTWGLDYASVCSRPDRSDRARTLPEAPCDLTKQNYCTTPGSNYPWHAIRRFVRENQGLMRRMYGEERHIAILKAELENFIEDDEDEDEMQATDFTEDIMKAKMMYSKINQGRALRNKPHFRPIQFGEKNKKVDNDTLRVKPLESNQTKAPNSKNATETKETIEEKGISYKAKLESIANIEINNLEQEVITLEAVIKQSIETNSIYPKSSNQKLQFNKKNATEKNVTTTESVNATEVTTDGYDDATTDSSKEGWKPVNADSSTLPPTLLFSEHEKVKTDVKSNNKKEEFHPKPTHPEPMRPTVHKLRGANACESKEQLEAPFWANNTRGETLALLNMYPFEQYVHLETCVHERKQMYCREGCRCEQQYRLHRLLAYDPHNECRGIFADWFRFPACCVCKCYDVPVEGRARAPRIRRPRYGDRLRRAIYQDAARDWYDGDDLY